MTDWMVAILVIGGTVVLSWPLGHYLRWAMEPLDPGALRRGYERVVGVVLGASATRSQSWKGYALSMLLFNAVMFTVIYAVLTTQAWLPLNPAEKPNLEPSLAFNTAASFTSNTNLQHYSGDVSLSYFSQLFAIMWPQFVSAAVGLAVVTALCRALAGRKELGNFYQDCWRAAGLVLLPLSLIVGAVLIVCGTPMTLEGPAVAQTLEGAAQTIARGPVAAVIAIKQLGTNGGGYFGPNSTHPLENPSFWSNLIECASIVIIPMAVVWMFGRITGRMRHAVVVFASMLALLLFFTAAAVYTESEPTAAFAGLPVEQTMNLEGKELRFGGSAGPVWAVATTSTSNGSVNAMHDSLNPLTGLVPMVGMWLNIEFGGVGVGLINMFVYIVVAVFIAGLMVGRTPEYLTRKVEAREMKLAAIALLAHPLFILAPVALFAATAWGTGTVQDPGSHGFSEIVYEFTSAAANNGSGFEGLSDNTVPWNIATGVVMLLARFVPIVAPLAIAGSLAAKRATPESPGTFRVDTPLFGVVLLATVLIVGALLFLPLAVLGPVAEHLSLASLSSAF